MNVVPYALLFIVLTLVHFIIINTMGGKHRKTHFSESFMKENFNEEHWSNFLKDAPKGGYPDCGNGLYSIKLDYK